MRIYNSLTRKVEEFVPMKPPVVKMYTCGPTVYDYPTIGNWRTYVMSDLLNRTLVYLGYEVEFVMNLTDVGHLTGDNLGDADTGEDRLEEAARREQKTAWDIAKFYGANFEESFSKLNLIKPMIFSKATEHIGEQIELIGEIEKKGFAYKIADGIYFDVAGYERAGNTYGELSNLDEIKKGARIEINQEKKDLRDFALWKFSPTPVGSGQAPHRQMEWDSPWGVGFPGWHIECSAMSMKYLGDRLDIHLGGEDLRSTHHPNEIAQSEAATGKKPFSRYWMHASFLLVDGGRMGKSLNNAFTLSDVEKRGYDPVALRYFFLSSHYRKQQNFTWEALEGVESALKRLRGYIVDDDGIGGVAEYETRFRAAIEDDLNMPEALAIVWELVKSDHPGGAKKASLLKFDEVLGLGLGNVKSQKPKEESGEVKKMLEKREGLRREKRFEEADKIRKQVEKLGVTIEDAAIGGEDQVN